MVTSERVKGKIVWLDVGHQEEILENELADTVSEFRLVEELLFIPQLRNYKLVSHMSNGT